MRRPRRSTIVVTAITLLAVATIAAVAFYPWRFPFHVSGTVVDTAGSPVPNALLSVRESTSFPPYTRTAYQKFTSLWTDAEGRFSFSRRGYATVSVAASTTDGRRSRSESLLKPGRHDGLRLVVRTAEEARDIGVSVGTDSPAAHTARRAATRAAATAPTPSPAPATSPAP